MKFDLAAHLERAGAFSLKTFGPGNATERYAGLRDHIEKELEELSAKPYDLGEWIDIVILALDGAWRTGASSEAIVAALAAKQSKNESDATAYRQTTRRGGVTTTIEKCHRCDEGPGDGR